MKVLKSSYLLIVWTLCLLVQPTASLWAQEKATPATKHSLWKIHGKSNSVYVFGSIHFLKKEFYPLPAPIEEAYKKSGVVVFETDIAGMESEETREKIGKAGKLAGEETLDQRVSKETYARLGTYLKNSGIPTNALDAYQPWMTAVALLGIELQKLGFQPDQGVEKYFVAKAQEDKKPMVGLETIDFQLSLFRDLSNPDQESMLKQTLGEISRFEKILAEMIDAWKTGDAQALDALIHTEMMKFPDLYKKLLLDRNKKWVGSLEKMLEGDKDVFVTVGAGHLVGKESVIDLLQKKGFKIEQL